MTAHATHNLWHALRQELGREVTSELLLENGPGEPAVVRRMHVEQRAWCAVAKWD